MLKKIEKGNYGYMSSNQKRNLVLTAICAVITVLLMGIGYALWHVKLNLLMVPAMLCVIPTANYLVAYLAVCMFSSADPERYEQVKAFDEAGMLVSDLVIVDEKGGRNGMEFAVIYKNGVVGFQGTKKNSKDMLEITVNDTLKKKSLPMRLKVYRDWNEFIKRISDLEAPDEEAKKRVELAREAMLSVSM